MTIRLKSHGSPKSSDVIVAGYAQSDGVGSENSLNVVFDHLIALATKSLAKKLLGNQEEAQIGHSRDRVITM